MPLGACLQHTGGVHAADHEHHSLHHLLGRQKRGRKASGELRAAARHAVARSHVFLLSANHTAGTIPVQWLLDDWCLLLFLPLGSPHAHLEGQGGEAKGKVEQHVEVGAHGRRVAARLGRRRRLGPDGQPEVLEGLRGRREDEETPEGLLVWHAGRARVMEARIGCPLFLEA